MKNRLKHSGASLAEVVEEGRINEVIGKMRVTELLNSCRASARSARSR